MISKINRCRGDDDAGLWQQLKRIILLSFQLSDKTIDLALVPIDMLRPHEEIVEDNLRRVLESIKRDQYVKKPIIVDRVTYVILDGHHRYTALNMLGAKYVPAYLIDYDDDSIVEVRSWKDNKQIPKRIVVEAGLRGCRFPPKTTRHIVKVPLPECWLHIDVLRGKKKIISVCGRKIRM
ncbi:MAG: ParB N-terminal domain-containing protein [Desulfurococcales archaeon]|nr:ParB N-terminal domain-containing protein [Desulfurococcales archaeon]MEB3789049.1 ParB N-terminal domain-containing protein [Desulfurococcales archaeon]